MAVAFGSSKSVTPTTGSTVTSASWTISGSNLVIILEIGISDNTATVSSVSWSLGSGTAVEIKNVRSGTAFGSVWAIPAPTAGTGTYTVNFSASIPFQVNGDYFTGADQTTPCPTGDAVSGTTSAAAPTGVTFTPSNLTANDAAVGIQATTVNGNPTAASPNQTYANSTTAVNALCGYSLGTGGVKFENDQSGGTPSAADVVVRIQTPQAGGAAVIVNLFRRLRGMGI